MKAAVCYDFGEPLRVVDVHLDPPQKGEVKIRMVATAICHSDVHFVRGEWKAPLPLVVGHESAGIVEEVGDGVTLTKPGDKVVVSLLKNCGRCFYCTMGLPYECSGEFALSTFSGNSRLHDMQGQALHHAMGTATFAEYAIVDQSQVVQVPDDFPLDRAALLACGVITGLGAAVNTAQVTPGSSVVVIGAGGVGLNAIQGALLSGANPIVALDTLDSKLEAARIFGATHGIKASADDVKKTIRGLTGGRGADYVLVTVGSTAALSQGLTLLRPAGTLVMVGLPKAGSTIPLPVEPLVWYNYKILGSNMGSTKLSVDVPRLIDLYTQGRLKLDELITGHYPLERINEAIEVMERGAALRNVIMF